MDPTLTQILQALVAAHHEIDTLRAELAALKANSDGLAIQPN